ncbi:MAG: enoyl-CoA hydratase/isomerase family protein [candidate division Zixibacteria bacterium]|nr:enoyl-CoA hydratase/isomerase family protein [candidate division Zixibacteria bacterium]
MSDYKNLEVEQKGKVLVVTINREKAMNALNCETVSELLSLFQERHDDNSFGCVIITGAGKAFVAGADITEIAKLDTDAGIAYSADGLKMMQAISDFPKPVIAAINGFALGGGSELALACDIRLASEKAKLGQPEVNLGIIPGFGGTQRLSRLVGRGKAMQLILTGAMINAQEAYRIGYVDEVYPMEELMDKALEMANLICSKGTLAVQFSKECIGKGLDLTLAAGCDLERDTFGKSCSTRDKNEGCGAFLEKRKAEFTGE